MYRIIKTDYNYDFYYMLPQDIINYNSRYQEPQKLIDNINNIKIQNLTVIGFFIKHENEYKATKTKILVAYHNIYYIILYNNLISTGKFTGRVECNNENIYYYLYSKRPLSTNHLEIIEIPNKKKIRAKDYIKVRCTKDGHEYYITLNKFFQNKKCPKCTNQIAYDMYNLTKFVYQKRPPEYTGIYITYIPFNINGKDDYLYLKCSYCETEWNTTNIHSYMNGGTGCPHCKISKGERKIKELLLHNNIKFEFQKKFKNCRNKKQLPFDFFINDVNVLIEYDGIQHFQPVEIFGGNKNYEQTLKNDQIKNQYCKDNNIRLIRIRYDEDPKEILTREGIIK